jgi:hypothetical protein
MGFCTWHILAIRGAVLYDATTRQSEAQFFMTQRDDRARLAECAARTHQKDSGASELVLASWLGVG